MERCLGLDVASPTTVIEDFYYHASLVNLAKMEKLVDKTIIEASGINWEDVGKFWDFEVSKFKIIKANFYALHNGSNHLNKKDNGLVYIELDICYDRQESWLSNRRKILGMENLENKKRWCSYNEFRLSKNKHPEPYTWKVTGFNTDRNGDGKPHDECDKKVIDFCKNYDFSNENIFIGNEILN